MIATLAEIKLILGIESDDTKHDAEMTALLLPIQRSVIEYLNNLFTVPNIYLESADLSFDAGDKKINLGYPNFDFTENYFANDMHVAVEGSADNNNIFQIETVAAQALTVADGEPAIVDEPAGRLIRVTKVKFPESLKVAFARMIEHQVKNKPARKGKKSESTGDYSVTYIEGLPDSIKILLAPHRKVRF